MIITRQDIKAECGTTYYKRGVAYFVKGRVRQLEVLTESHDAVSFQATVAGSSSRPYTVEVHLRDKRQGFTFADISITGYCSCPMEYNCKHVAAACLKYLDTAELFQTVGSSAFSWLDSLAKANTNTPLVPDRLNKIHFLILLLSATPEPGLFQLTAKYSYYKQKGGLVKPRNLATSLAYESRYNNYQEHDQELLLLMQALTNGDYDNTCDLRGELGAQLIHRAVKTGRCYWQDYHEQQSFAWGPEESMRLDWQTLKSGAIKLLPVFARPALALLLTNPVLYVDNDQMRVGPVTKSDFSVDQLKTILAAPVVPTSAIHSLSQKLAVAYPQLKIPQPTPVTITPITAAGMTPRLTLFQMETDRYRFHALELQFKYSNILVALHPQEAVTNIASRAEVFQIQRDLELENKKVQQLETLGFKLVQRLGKASFFYSAAGNLMASATRWHSFVEHEIPHLEAAGWEIIYDKSYALSFEVPNDWYAGLEETDNDWFELRFDVEIDGKKQALVPLIVEVLDTYAIDDIPATLAIPLAENNFVVLQRSQIMPVVQTLFELFNYQSDRDAFKLNKYDAAQLAELDAQHEQLQIKGARDLIKLGRKLRDFTGIEAVKLPASLGTTLRDYQQFGVEWLQFLRAYQLNGILADDMGLGKTVEVLTHLLIEKDQGRLQQPCLIVAPTSLMSNWRREIGRFTPELSVLTLQGPQRHERFESIEAYDVVLSTYPLLPRDHEQLQGHHWYYIILDEAQMVKNPKARASKIIRQLSSEHRLCLTGTPLENHLGELWSLFDFLMPGFLADEKTFNLLFRKPIEKYGQQGLSRDLAKKVSPFLLRRSKREVLSDLPPKSELTRSVELGAAQAKLYESIRLAMERKVRSAIAKNGLARSHITILDALLKLRQVCCDPRLLKLTQAGQVKRSAKLELLMQILPEMLEEGRRVLLFSQFTSMLALIEPELEKQGITYSKLTGQTRKREAVIDEFKSGKTDIFLISLKAGGLGLNLTEADTVIIYDPWWNPAVEAQAADRTYRIGQNKAVFVYKLIVENSVEEKILALQEQKKALAEGIYGSGKPDDAQSLFSAADITELLAPLG